MGARAGVAAQIGEVMRFGEGEPYKVIRRRFLTRPSQQVLAETSASLALLSPTQPRRRALCRGSLAERVRLGSNVLSTTGSGCRIRQRPLSRDSALTSWRHSLSVWTRRFRLIAQSRHGRLDYPCPACRRSSCREGLMPLHTFEPAGLTPAVGVRVSHGIERCSCSGGRR